MDWQNYGSSASPPLRREMQDQKRFYFVEITCHNVMATTPEEAEQLLRLYLDEDGECEGNERVRYATEYSIEQV
jgi:hypothetical protein